MLWELAGRGLCVTPSIARVCFSYDGLVIITHTERER